MKVEFEGFEFLGYRSTAKGDWYIETDGELREDTYGNVGGHFLCFHKKEDKPKVREVEIDWTDNPSIFKDHVKLGYIYWIDTTDYRCVKFKYPYGTEDTIMSDGSKASHAILELVE